MGHHLVDCLLRLDWGKENGCHENELVQNNLLEGFARANGIADPLHSQRICLWALKEPAVSSY